MPDRDKRADTATPWIPDIEIGDGLAVRPSAATKRADFIQIRIRDSGWHGEAANLDREQAAALRALLDDFIGDR